MNQTIPPFDEMEVRQAVNYARGQAAPLAPLRRPAEPGCNFLPPGLPGHEPIDPCPYGDPAERA